ncbi:MAG: MFS transporter [Paracoccaceae bacterium]
MGPGLIALALAYVLSQFFRAFLAVLADPLANALGATPEHLAGASGIWFLSFALMQIPVGEALDRVGPRRTASVLLALAGGGGAAVFALATAPWHISAAMLLIGIGCSPVLMASYFIFARQYPPAQFATLAAVMLGTGSVGNLLSAYPMTYASDLLGWRGALWALSAACVIVGALIWAYVNDPPRARSTQAGSVLDLLKMPVLWPIFALMLVNYAPAGAIRGLWIGPYLSEVYSQTAGQVGQATLIMGGAMIAGTFAVGPLDKLLGTRKWVIFAGCLICALSTLALALSVGNSAFVSIALMALIGFTGGTFPVILAHARSFFPPHLTGRGVTLVNLFGIGGVGIMQFASGRLHTAASGLGTEVPYALIFAFFGGALLLGCLVYLFSQDRVD